MQWWLVTGHPLCSARPAAAGTLGVLYVWGRMVYLKPKGEYNALHPYTSWIPITAFCVLRNLTPGLRLTSLALFGWLGRVSLALVSLSCLACPHELLFGMAALQRLPSDLCN